MNKLKIFYSCSLGIFVYSLFSSPKANLIDPDFLILTIITVGIPLVLAPLFMLTKSEKFYKAAKHEGRTRKARERTDPPVEEEYKSDSILLTVLFSSQLLLMSYFLWK